MSSPNGQSSWMKKAFSELFGVDLRSLAIMRILLGMILIRDLFVRAQYLETFYTDYGALPRYVVLDFWERPMYISAHMMSGSWTWQAILFILAQRCVI